jgi:hypothetical protein
MKHPLLKPAAAAAIAIALLPPASAIAVIITD